jgi:hypothetical protein
MPVPGGRLLFATSDVAEAAVREGSLTANATVAFLEGL